MIYPNTFEDKIGMTEIRQMLKQHCLSPLGHERVEQMAFLTDAKRIRQLHTEVGELARLEAETDGLTLLGILREVVNHDF